MRKEASATLTRSQGHSHLGSDQGCVDHLMIRFRRTQPALLASVQAISNVTGVGGRVIYGIGDVHGRNDILVDMLDMIRSDVEGVAHTYPPALVFLGDYIDRGSASDKVIDTLIALKADPTFEVITLRGNHDQFLLDVLREPSKGAMWVNYGGAQTLLAYGVAPPRRPDEESWAVASAKLREALPAEHRNFLEHTGYCAIGGSYAFVHAGVRPNVQLEAQKAADVLAIRDTFLDALEPLPGRTVVFGHTPFEKPLVELGKIGIDTGACATGVLTALCIDGERRRFLQTGPTRKIFDVPAPSSKAQRPRRL